MNSLIWVDLWVEPIPGALGVNQAHILDGIQGHGWTPYTHTFTYSFIPWAIESVQFTYQRVFGWWGEIREPPFSLPLCVTSIYSLTTLLGTPVHLLLLAITSQPIICQQHSP